ncbi:hypothetical protein PXNS11_460006 [Stutzerimonas xanthomarina]|nr:hypothetical protein PXNS11_460006 [Stutzerimonas xanthomarina]
MNPPVIAVKLTRVARLWYLYIYTVIAEQYNNAGHYSGAPQPRKNILSVRGQPGAGGFPITCR